MFMKQAIFHLKRDHEGVDSQGRKTTLGIMYTPTGEKFGYTLEDVIRPYGEKVKKETAIPKTEEGFTYKVTIRTSPKYGKVAVIYTHKNGEEYILNYGGVKFSYILVHGGNHADHTEGCVLCARNRVTDNGKMAIQGSLKTEFMKEVESFEKEGYEVRLKVTNP